MRDRINTIWAKNFKGATFEHELAPVTLFYGDNMTNKSSRVEALVLSLLGYLPGVGAKPADLYARLASGQVMAVGVETAKAALDRSWTLNNGSVRHLCTGECEELDWPAEALDLSGEFLSLSPAEKVKFLFRRSQLPARLKLESVKNSLVGAIKGIILEENTAESEEALLDVANALRDLPGDDTQSWLAEVVECLRAERNAADQNVKTLQKTVQGMAAVDSAPAAPLDAEQVWKKAKAVEDEARRELAKLQTEGRLKASELARLKSDSGTKELADLSYAAQTAQAKLDSAAKRVFDLKDERDEAAESGDCPQCGGKKCACWKKSKAKAAKATAAALKAATQERVTLSKAALKANTDYQRALKEHADKTKAAVERAEKEVAEMRISYQAANDKVQQLMAATTAAQTARDALVAQRARNQQREQVKQQLHKGQIDLEVNRLAFAVASDLLAKTVAEVVGSLIEKANRLCGQLLKHPLEYDREQMDVGMRNEAGWFWSHRSWSGIEKALGYAALSVALAQDAPVRLIVIDELGRLDAKRKGDLVAALIGMYRAGDIDQAILVDVAQTFPASVHPDFKQIEIK